MTYTPSLFKDKVEEYGEVFVVLDSDREYIVHGTSGYETFDNNGETFIKVEGVKCDDYVIAEFPVSAIEHVYTHREV